MIEPTTTVDLQAMALTIGSFLLIGAGANYSQYVKKIEDNPEKWRLDRAVPTLLVGGAGGLLAYLMGMPPEIAAVSGILGGLVPIVDEVRSSSLTFYEVFSIAKQGGDSPAASARRGAEAAAEDVDVGRVKQGVEDIQEAAEESGSFYRDPEGIVEGVPEDFDEERREALGLPMHVESDSDDETDGETEEVVTDGP